MIIFGAPPRSLPVRPETHARMRPNAWLRALSEPPYPVKAASRGVQPSRLAKERIPRVLFH